MKNIWITSGSTGIGFETAKKIYNGLTKKYRFEIYFPTFFLLLKTFKIIPYRFYFYLIRKVTKL